MCNTSSNVTDLYQDSRQVRTKKSRSQSAKSYPSARALFEKHVSESPESICIQFENSESLTSKELNHGSDSIASKLLKMGVQAKSRVATCLEISVQSLQIFIALLKIGAVYVPLDSREMPSKLRHLAQRCKADFVITSSKASRIFERIQQISTNISIEKLFSSDSEVDETTKPKNNASPSDVCCILYESTENGHKEVVLTHGMMSIAIVKIGKQLAIDRDTRYLQASTWTLSMFDIFCVFVHGGCVVLTSRCENSGDLSKRVSKFGINTILLSSTALHHFDMHNDTLSQLRSLIIGRETSRPTRLKHLLKNVAVYHVCGQAETGGWRRVREIKKVEDWDKIKIPTVGHHWVLKADDISIVPDGAMGELCYSGPDLADGCISESAVGAVVRTGDLVRCTSDGDIQFLGRKEDSMVINGQSINVFEVEKAFSEHASSELSFSIINTTRGGKPVLAAFVVLPQTNHSSKGDAVLQAAIGGSEISEIQQSLQEKLVASLATVAVPTLWIPIRILPRTSSDSLDRNALRKLLTEELISIVEKKRTKTVCKPKTLTETILYEQWKKLLSLADDAALSIDDNFFQLGGDSLMAMKLSAGLGSKLHISVLDIFENPTIRSLGRRLDSLSSKKLEQVEVEEDFSLLKISKEEVEETKVLAAKQCGVSPDDIIDIYPCSPLQEGLTVESMKDARLNVGKYVFILPPKTDISRLRNAWEAVIDGNEILRTRIVPSDKGFIQVVLRHEELELNTFEKADNENALEEFVQNDELHKISPPKNMMKLTLLTVKGTTYLVWTIHHAIYDGISTTMILGDLFKAYNSNPITQRPKYRTFIRELLGSDGKAAAQYWKSQVTGQSPNVWPSVPRDYSPGTIKVDKFYLKTNLMNLSESLGCTGATILRAGWGLVAAIHAGTDDITFGVTNSGRNFSSNASVQDVNGPCIVTLPLRINKDSNHSIRDYIKGQMTRDREMMRQEFFGLQEISKINDELKAMCNFGSLLVVQNTFQAPLQLAEDPIQLVEQHGYIGYPLVLECSIIGAGNIEVTAHYDEGILSTAEIGFLIGHFENAILAFEKPDTSVGDINYINKAEYEQIMKWCEAVPEPSPGEQRQLHQIFEEQATLYPNAPAVQFEDEPSMSYSELNQEANKFARHLQILGVLPKEVVAICLDRGVRTIVVILGILKAGAGYVPLDSEHPPSRLQGILDDCQSKFVVTKKEYRDRFEGHAVSLIEVDDNVHENYDDHNLGLIGSTAYVIFTSGSTGKPKGVAMSHLAAVKSCQSHNHIAGLSPGRRVFGVSTYTFDASIFDYFTTLLHGGCLCLASKSSLRNLAKMIDLAQADTMFLTPTVLRLMNPSEVPSLKMIILGGEPPSASDIEIWGDCLNLILCYGPTEACVYSSLHPHAKPKVTPPSSLGWPVGSKNWVLDQNLNILPVGVPGELHLSGYPLADGYIGDTEKTNKVFVPSPFEKRQRLYKTGDYVQWNADGSLRFFARIDNLVKIHGLRIELGDIEHNITQAYPGKKIMVDVIRTDPTNPILTAFIEVHSQKGTSYWVEGDEESRKLFERLEEHAVGNLPRYMVPKVWVPVAEFPQTTSGKTDRKTMLMTFSEAPELIKKYTIMRKKVEDGSAASFSGMELKLREIWAKILSLGEENIGVEDDFFVLGGDSLAAIRVGALCMRNELDLTITDIFKHRTIRKLAKLIEEDEKSGGKITKSELVKPFSLIDSEELSDCLKEATTQCRVTEDQIEDVYPCTSLQQGMIALSSMDNGSYFAKQSYLLSPSTDIERFRQAWALVTQHNPILRTRFIDTDSGILQVVLKKEELKWEIDSHESSEEYCARPVDCEDIYGQNLSQFHLFKRAQDGGWHFVWTSHHSLYDGMSVGLFMSDLYDAYDNPRTTRQFTPYNQFIKYLNGIEQKESEEFWKTLFTDITPTKFPAFPTANYRPRTTKLFRHQFAIPKKTLNEVSVSEYVRSAWALVISILSETDDTSFGVTLSGRNAPLAGIDEVNGPTITTFPTRIRVGEGLLAHEFLSSVHEQVVSAIPYEHTGIQNISTLSADCKTACEFRSLLVAQPAQQDVKSSGLSMQPVSSEIQHSYAIVLESMPSDGGLELVVSYDGNILEEAQIACITASVEAAITQLMTSS
jgi:amino acid adenylation domain-containing protein